MKTPSSRPARGDSRPPRVAVVSEHSLVQGSVRAALAARGIDLVDVGGDPPPEVGLLLSDLDSPARIHQARRLVSEAPLRWLVLAGSPPGVAWGALYDSGVVLIMPASTRLDQICRAAGQVRTARRQPTSRRRRALIESWRVFERQRSEREIRVESLTARERQVLTQLHAGTSVGRIAEAHQVKEATVRSHVKAILRKLGVNSQLAAVQVFESLRSEAVQ